MKSGSVISKSISTFVIATALTLVTSYTSALPKITDTRIEKLPVLKLKLGGRTIAAEIADSDDERERGLMYRKSMGADEGMLFVFEEEQEMAFWMKNTLIPLSIGYFDGQRRLLNTVEMTPAVMGEARPKTYPAKGAALYALEMNKGWFTKHAIKPGTVIEIPTTKVGP